MSLVKYGNRKIYYPREQRYVTYKELDTLFKQFPELSVTCHKTKLDITTETKRRVAFYVGQ